MIKEIVPLGTTKHLPHKATLPRLRPIANLPPILKTNTKRQTKWGDKERSPKLKNRRNLQKR